MTNEKRLIDAIGKFVLNAGDLTGHIMVFENGYATVFDRFAKVVCKFSVLDAPTVDAVEVVHGNWNIRCETHRDYHTGEVDEDFYLECSECHRKVWDVRQDDVLLGRYGKICNDYPYCHCGAKMDGGNEDGNL